MKGFLVNKKAEKNEVLIQELLHSYQGLGYKMSFKIHFFNSYLDPGKNSYLDFFPDNPSAVSDEQGVFTISKGRSF